MTSQTLPARLSGDIVRFSMSRVILAWAFGSIFFQFSSGAIYAAFTRQLGAGEATFGFLAGVLPLMSVLQIAAARILEKMGRPKRQMLLVGLLGRFLWVVGASLPLLHRFFPVLVPRAAILPGFVGCVVLSSALQALTSPAFFQWMGALVPDRVSPAFWARRHQIGTLVAVFAVLGGNTLADRASWFNDTLGGDFPPLLLYSALLMLAAVCGMADIGLFWNVRVPPTLAHDHQNRGELPPLWKSLREPLRERSIRRYLAFAACNMVGAATTGPWAWLFCLEIWDSTKRAPDCFSQWLLWPGRF